jgi:hypothetical protein
LGEIAIGPAGGGVVLAGCILEEFLGGVNSYLGYYVDLIANYSTACGLERNSS